MTSFSPLQLATLVAVLGSLAAVFIPQFSANFRASRIAEPLDGLQQISQRAAVLAAGASVKEAYPPSAPLTPAEIPQGELVEDPVGTWSLPTWQRLGFSQRSPHAFSLNSRAATVGQLLNTSPEQEETLTAMASRLFLKFLDDPPTRSRQKLFP